MFLLDTNVGSGLTAGDFTLELDGETTLPLPFDATASDIQAALEALGTIGSGNVEVVETAAHTFEITFVGALSKLNIAPLVIAETSNLSGPLELETITTQTASAGVNEQQQIEFSTAPDAGGQFTLSFNGATTPPISVPASAGSVQAQLEALPTIGSGNIVVSGPTDGPWEIEFQNELRSRNQASIVVDTTPFSPNNDPQNLRTSGRIMDVVESVEASGQNELQRVSLPSGVTARLCVPVNR